jgi:hypothetical protein
MLIEIALGKDLSLNIMGHSKIKRWRIAPLFSLRADRLKIRRKSAENHEIVQIGT